MSCKAESIKSWNRVREQLREAIDMSFGTGATPALALLDDDGEEMIVMRLSDLAQALSTPAITAAQPGRGEMARGLVDTPAMLRGS